MSTTSFFRRLTINQATKDVYSGKYRDVPFFLIFIPLVNVLNYYLTYSQINFSWYTCLTFLIDTLQGYAAWWGVRAIITYLDKKLPYANQPLKRIYLQVLLTTLSGLLIIIGLTELLNYLVKDTPVPVVFYSYDIFIFLIWFLVINGIYIGLHFYGEWKRAESLRVEEKKVRSEGYVVKVGKQNLSLPFEEITGFYVDGDYSVLVSQGDKRYFLDQSLDKIEQSIPSEWFFRLNRQFIVNRKAIQGFKRVENNKLDILICASTYFPEVIQVSRTKAPAFKMWFDP